ncbi:MAG TPA: PLP-dependent aminotransferase family protein [Candidatus Eremiobacteraeota bacterium]|nr:MAG: 2-aminoadipate transaminase [bacterium ADurb.Bin363]HPZ08049.1 PLP-dependent aminotransferase family protein [Candidatus Eremiobacteraeota bacterium]
MIDLVKNYGIHARRIKASVIRELLKLTNKPGMISFAGGLPDPKAFPVEDMKDICATVIDEFGDVALQYGPTEGLPELKKELIKLAARDGVNIKDENILVTVSSQQGLDLIGKIFIDPSDPVIVELPSYIGGLQVFHGYGASMIGIPTDDDGILLDQLEETLEKLKGTEEHYKFIYLVPDFQNPAGVTLSQERRKKIIEISRTYDILVIEDTPYRQLRFEGTSPDSLMSLDNTNNIISVYTFSKIFVPGLRLGWIIAHPSIIRKLALAKQSVDLCTPTFTQLIAYEFCRRGLLEKHIEKVKAIYHKKRDVMLKALEEYMPKVEGLRWTKPQGGLFLWLILPKHINADKLFYEAVEENVAFVIGSAFHCNGKGQNTMRLNFSYPTHEEIHEGIHRLAKAIKNKLK